MGGVKRHNSRYKFSQKNIVTDTKLKDGADWFVVAETKDRMTPVNQLLYVLTTP